MAWSLLHWLCLLLAVVSGKNPRLQNYSQVAHPAFTAAALLPQQHYPTLFNIPTPPRGAQPTPRLSESTSVTNSRRRNFKGSTSSTTPQDSADTELRSKTFVLLFISGRLQTYIEHVLTFLLEAADAEDVNWEPSLSGLGTLLKDINSVIKKSGNPAPMPYGPYGPPVDQEAMTEWLLQLTSSLGNDLIEFLINRPVSLDEEESAIEWMELIMKINDMLMKIGKSVQPPSFIDYKLYIPAVKVVLNVGPIRKKVLWDAYKAFQMQEFISKFSDKMRITVPSSTISETELTSFISERLTLHIGRIQTFLLEAADAEDVNWEPALSGLGNLLEDINSVIGKSGNPAAVSSVTGPYSPPVDQKAMPKWLKQLSLSLGKDLREFLINKPVSLDEEESAIEWMELIKKIYDMLMQIGKSVKPSSFVEYEMDFATFDYVLNVGPMREKVLRDAYDAFWKVEKVKEAIAMAEAYGF